MTETSKFAADALAERVRQINGLGWAPDHDDGHGDGTLTKAAACYVMRHVPGTFNSMYPKSFPELWPFDREWWHPTNRRQDLIRAVALLIAEGDRLDRAEARRLESRTPAEVIDDAISDKVGAAAIQALTAAGWLLTRAEYTADVGGAPASTVAHVREGR